MITRRHLRYPSRAPPTKPACTTSGMLDRRPGGVGSEGGGRGGHERLAELKYANAEQEHVVHVQSSLHLHPCRSPGAPTPDDPRQSHGLEAATAVAEPGYVLCTRMSLSENASALQHGGVEVEVRTETTAVTGEGLY